MKVGFFSAIIICVCVVCVCVCVCVHVCERERERERESGVCGCVLCVGSVCGSGAPSVCALL
jgi:hypothetical protein